MNERASALQRASEDELRRAHAVAVKAVRDSVDPGLKRSASSMRRAIEAELASRKLR